MNQAFLMHLLFYWITPLAVMTGAFLLLREQITTRYEKFDLDKWVKLFVTVGIIAGFLIAGYLFMTHNGTMKRLIGLANDGINIANKQENVRQATTAMKNQGLHWWQIAIQFLIHWSPVYFRAWILSWIICFAIAIQSLVWRIAFGRGANIIVSTIILYPWLVFKYLLGYQTPFFDFVQARLFVARLKENLNDSYFDALSGYDDKGQKFENGAGGTVQTQRIKQTALAVRQTKARIKTAGGTRHAELITRQSRETDTDRMIETAMKGLGLRLSASNIRFQDSPVLDVERGGYVFDSDISFNAGDELGGFNSLFQNPFGKESQVKAGGPGLIKVLWRDVVGLLTYIAHLTPTGIYEHSLSRFRQRYSFDTSLDRAKYIAQENLDLSVLPDPIDPETGNDIETQRIVAKKVAKARIDDVASALNSFKIHGSFKGVEVNGNQATYSFALTRDSNLPTDFNKIQDGIANLLQTKDVPVIRLSAGILSVTMVNGVNIPVDFKDMLRKAPKGMPGIITGYAGVDAQGHPIEVALGDKNPHIMIFGKTGTGKTVTIMTILYSMMHRNDPKRLKIAYVDGKGNSFEFMRTDNKDSANYHPNPFTYLQPADASGDIEYARAVLNHITNETRRRIDLFKKVAATKLEDYNKKFPDKALPEILLVVDEFSAITQQDKDLKGEDLVKKGTIDNLEYIAKMARSVGIRMMLANQSARKELVPGKITANVTGRLTLGVAEPIESEIALPDSGIAAHLISQPGEFYSTLHGARNVEHGNSPYLTDDNMYALNDSLEKKLGHQDYAFTREQIMAEMNSGTGIEGTTMDMPDPLPDKETPVDELIKIINQYPEWAYANRQSDVFIAPSAPHYMKGATSKVTKARLAEVNAALENVGVMMKNQKQAENADTHKHQGAKVASITKGSDQGVL